MTIKPRRYEARDGTVTWRVPFRLGGRGARGTSETFATKKDADRFTRDIEDFGAVDAVRRLEERIGRDTAQTVAQVTEQFLTWKATRVRSDRTIADYRRDWRLWIAPTFGHRPVQLVTRRDIQTWVDNLAAGDLGRKPSPKSVHDRHALLHAILKYAVRQGLISTNPAVETDLPKIRRGQPHGVNPAEWAALYAALRQLSPDGADLAQFLLASGWRWSEATALTTYDIEDYGAQMRVTMSHVGRRNAAGQVIDVQDAKGDASLRRMALGPGSAQMVRRRLAWTTPGGYVFTTPVSLQNGLGGNRWHYGNFRRDAWDPAVRLANLTRKPTPHWLRHSAVDWLDQSGGSLAQIQARIGHESIETTIGTYGRLITDVPPDVLAKFDAMVAPDENRLALPNPTLP